MSIHSYLSNGVGLKDEGTAPVEHFARVSAT